MPDPEWFGYSFHFRCDPDDVEALARAVEAALLAAEWPVEALLDDFVVRAVEAPPQDDA